MVRGTQQHEVQMAREETIEERMARIAAGNGDDEQQQSNPQVADMQKRLEQFERRDQARDTAAELGIPLEQAIAVNEVRLNNPSLSTAEAFAIAQSRDPDAFGAMNPRAYNPGQHGSLRPRGGGVPPQQQPKSIKQRAQEIAAMPDPLKRMAAERHLIGSMAAKAAGWQYPDFKG
jgi:hypothetical protein